MTFTEEIIEAAWRNGRAVSGHDPDAWRKDQCGAWIERTAYGESAAEFGWHIQPVRPGETGSADNLRPFNCLNRYDVATGRACCMVTAEPEGRANRPPG